MATSPTALSTAQPQATASLSRASYVLPDDEGWPRPRRRLLLWCSMIGLLLLAIALAVALQSGALAGALATDSSETASSSSPSASATIQPTPTPMPTSTGASL